MVGRDVLFRVHKDEAKFGDVILEVSKLTANSDRGLPALRGVEFKVRTGEIYGVAGVAGNGQSELAEVITELIEGDLDKAYYTIYDDNILPFSLEKILFIHRTDRGRWGDLFIP